MWLIRSLLFCIPTALVFVLIDGVSHYIIAFKDILYILQLAWFLFAWPHFCSFWCTVHQYEVCLAVSHLDWPVISIAWAAFRQVRHSSDLRYFASKLSTMTLNILLWNTYRSDSKRKFNQAVAKRLSLNVCV